MDFVSQSSFEAGLELPEDSLGHDALAKSILWSISHLAPGAVLGIQGPWGRGKTDVLARVAQATYGQDTCPKELARKAIWVNP